VDIRSSSSPLIFTGASPALATVFPKLPPFKLYDCFAGTTKSSAILLTAGSIGQVEKDPLQTVGKHSLDRSTAKMGGLQKYHAARLRKFRKLAFIGERADLGSGSWIYESW
tara:strand:- start:859 stop:1191 length:333 start_codon:yes stop_codon:yes gene_type:complete